MSSPTSHETDLDASDAEPEHTDPVEERVTADPVEQPGPAGTGATDTDGPGTGPAPAATDGPGRHRRFLLAVVVLTILIVAALAAGTVVAVGQIRQSSEASHDQAAVDTARDVVMRLSSLGGQGPGLKTQLDGLLALSTGPFRTQLTGAADLLTNLADKARFTSQGSVPAAGLEHSDGQLATVLVVSQSQVSNVEAPQGNLRRYQLAVTLQWDGSHWLAQTVDQVS